MLNKLKLVPGIIVANVIGVVLVTLVAASMFRVNDGEWSFRWIPLFIVSTVLNSFGSLVLYQKLSSEKPRFTTRSLLWLAAICVVLAVGVHYVWSNHESIPETTESGDRIITALEQYKADFGTYPSDLQTLLPHYLKDIPQPRWGLRQWLYNSNGDRFDLQVNESAKTGDGDSQWLKYLPNRGWETGD